MDAGYEPTMLGSGALVLPEHLDDTDVIPHDLESYDE